MLFRSPAEEEAEEAEEAEPNLENLTESELEEFFGEEPEPDEPETQGTIPEEEILFDDDEIEEEEEPASAEPSLEEAAAPAEEYEYPEEEADEPQDTGSVEAIPEGIRTEIKSVLSYMDQLLESLPEEKIQEFANSDHFDVYKRLFDELGLSS